MTKNVKGALKLAVITGFMAGTASKAMAGDKVKTAESTDKAHAEKGNCSGPNGCNGSCPGKDAKKDKMKKGDKMADKHSCGANGCGGSDHKAAPAETAAPATPEKKK